MNYTDPSGKFAKNTRNGLGEPITARIDGAGKIVIWWLETVWWWVWVVWWVGMCTTGIWCIWWWVAVVYGGNYVIAGSTNMWWWFIQLITGERNDLYFNAWYSLIDATIEDETTREYSKLALDLGDIWVWVVKVGTTVIRNTPKYYKSAKEWIQNGRKKWWELYDNSVNTLWNAKDDFNKWLDSLANKISPTPEPVLVWWGKLPNGKVVDEGADGNMMKSMGWLSWITHGSKHTLPPNTVWNKKIIESTAHGWDAKYLPWTNVEELERNVWETWTMASNGKNWKVKAFNYVIWASDGKESKRMRVENSANTIHWHPIPIEEYLKLTK